MSTKIIFPLSDQFINQTLVTFLKIGLQLQDAILQIMVLADKICTEYYGLLGK